MSELFWSFGLGLGRCLIVVVISFMSRFKTSVVFGVLSCPWSSGDAVVAAVAAVGVDVAAAAGAAVVVAAVVVAAVVVVVVVHFPAACQ